MQFSTIVGEASVKSTNLRLQNPFEPIWDNIGKLTHFFNEMPSKFSTTYHMKSKQKDYQYKRTFHPNANFY
jgi:nitrogen fixation/metabolism regulation signal transduction histidine kinase